MRSSLSPRCGAFSLVELLIVVGLIALLIGILLPVLRAAREDARAVRCASNVRQISLALVLYTEAHQGRLPIPGSAFIDPTGPYQAVWMTGWAVYDYDNGTLWSYLGAAGPDLRKQVLDCPADADSGFRPAGTAATFPQQYGYKPVYAEAGAKTGLNIYSRTHAEGDLFYQAHRFSSSWEGVDGTLVIDTPLCDYCSRGNDGVFSAARKLGFRSLEVVTRLHRARHPLTARHWS